MTHTYAKAPPAFAKDPWAWDYTRDRMEDNTGLTYPEWEGKHFAGAAAMYKNVVKKYRASMEANALSLPRECVDCGQVQPHYNDDYVCQPCRDLIEQAPTYEAAAATITQPESIDVIRDQLYKALGHDKKDAKKAQTPGQPFAGPGAQAIVPDPIAQAKRFDAAMERGGEWNPVTSGKVSRNYKAMSASKLDKCISELESRTGDAARRATDKGEHVLDHLEAALRAQQGG